MALSKIFMALAAIALSVAVGLSSFVIANEVRAPHRAYAVGVAPQGIARANVALNMWIADRTRNPKAPISARQNALAVQAFRSEPLSASAMSVMVTARSKGSGSVEHGRLLQLAGQLTRRNSLINQEQVTAAALRNDQRAVFAWLSRSVLTNNKVRDTYVTAMADLTGREGAVAALAPIVGPSPEWSDFYWRTVVRRPQSLVNAARLRMTIAGGPWRKAEITPADRDLSAGLVKIGEYAVARDLAGALGQRKASEGQPGLMSNTSFTRQPSLPPFDWQLIASGSMGSSIDEKSGRLLVSAIGGANGTAATQLLQLAPGNYVLDWTLSSGVPLAPDTLSARLFCAERGRASPRIAPVSLLVGDHRVPVAVPESECRWYWLAVDAVVGDGSGGVDASFDHLLLAPSTGSAMRTVQ